MNQGRTILITGVAGFIGMHVAQCLLKAGEQIVGLDNLNPYYDVDLKEARLERLRQYGKFSFVRMDLVNHKGTEALFSEYRPEVVIHLAAQAGVRYSLQDPFSYSDSNLTGFLSILEACRHGEIKHLVFASSSSVYGANSRLPLSVADRVDRPVSLYGATKRAGELMAYSYAHLYKIPTTGLRFFTVYGPWGRPDMAYFFFTRDILAGRTIKLFNHGAMKRDFTFISDIVDGIQSIAESPPGQDEDGVPFRVYNIGNDQPVSLGYFIEVLERILGVRAVTEMYPMQPGDVISTHADIAPLRDEFGFNPGTSIEEGLAAFVAWYRGYYQ